MAKDNNKQNAHYLVSYVASFQRLNDIELEIPQDESIDEILSDPMTYALDFIESEFAKHSPSFIKAFELGQNLAKDNLK